MRRSTRWILGILSAACVASGAAWATEPEGGAGKGQGRAAQWLESKDADGNGEISRDEWMTSCEARFDKMDADGSGGVTGEEMKAARQKQRQRRSP